MASKRDTGKDIADNTKKSAKFEKDAKDALNKIAGLQDKYMKFYSLDRRNQTPWKRAEVKDRKDVANALKGLQNDMKKLKQSMGIVEKETKKKNKKDGSKSTDDGGEKKAQEKHRKGIKGIMAGFAKSLSPLKLKGKDKGEQTGNAMKDAMKFAVGGSIVGILGKKLFDSSPLLKTMMSLFNTSIMLIFRPIGDFIGSFLRPIMLFFMKNIAIPFYKNSKHAMGLGEQFGKQALGFLLKPIETIHAAIVSGMAEVLPAWMLGGEANVNSAKTYSGVTHWQLDQSEKLGLISEDVRKWADQQTGKEGGWGRIQGWIAAVMQGSTSSGSDALAKQGITDIKTMTPIEAEAERMAENVEEGANYLDELVLSAERAAMDGKLTEDEMAKLLQSAQNSLFYGIATEKAYQTITNTLEKASNDLARRFNNFREAQLASGKGRASKTTIQPDTINTLSSFLQGKVNFTTPEAFNAVPSPAQRSSPKPVSVLNPAINSAASQKARTDAYKHLTNPGGGTMSYQDRIEGKTLDEILGIQKAMGIDGVARLVVGDEGAAILKAVEDAKADGSVKFSNDKEARKHAAAFSAAMTKYELFGGTKPVMGDLTNIINGKPAGSKGYAHGGLITEPIFGIGRSGQTYTFGERGQETVTPGKGGTNYILNINVGNITKEADFDKLRPLVQRWILEANSRRGVV